MKNLVLVGFMGSGKTAVGKQAAAQLGLRFVDTDDLIEQRAGKTISAIFADDGEPHFRALERAVVQHVAATSDQVIATGGGVVLNPANISDFAATGVVICLWAEPEAILQRTATSRHRPLLEQDADREKRLRELLAQREPLYRAISLQVDNTHTTVEQDVERVIRIYRDQTTGM